MTNIKELVAEKISAAGPEVQDRVINKLAEVEILRRSFLVEQSIGRLDTLEKELKKIDRDDQEAYVQGARVSSMSKVRYDLLQKSKENIKRLSDCLNGSLEKNDYETFSKLDETLKKLNNVNSGGDKKESSGEGKE